MVSNLAEVRLGDLAKVKGGKRMPSGTALVATKTSHPYIRIVDFYDGSVNTSGLLYVPEAAFPAIRRYTISSRDVYISIVGTIGVVGMVPKELEGANLTENAAKICDFDDKLSPDFLSFFLRSQEGQQRIHAMTVGSTQPKLALFRIADLRIPCPPHEEQLALAEILSTIEKRLRILNAANRTLEQIAQSVFQSWFMDFGPVRAKAEGREPEGMDAATAALFPYRLSESENASIPAGWSLKRLDEFLHINPPRSLSKSTPAPYLEMANAPTSGPRPSAWVDTMPISGCRFKNGDTLLAKITPCLENGKTAYIDFLKEAEIGWGSTEFIVLAPKGAIPAAFAYLLARHPDFRAFAIQSMSGTSGRQRVQVDQLANFVFAITG